MKKEVKVVCKGSKKYAVRIDDKLLVFKDGKAVKNCAPGVHVLTYIALGPSGSKFGIAITAPKEAVWGRVISMVDGIAAGVKKFKVNQS